jgi:monofunctional chorismate mutase
MHIRGIRGATTAEANTPQAILDATCELLHAIVSANHVEPDEVAAVFFTATADLDAAYPAEAARRLGWHAVPLLAFADIPVQGSLCRCIRVLVLWNTPRTQGEVVHVYLREAVALRPDLKSPPLGGMAGGSGG